MQFVFEDCHGLQYLEQLENHLNRDIQTDTGSWSVLAQFVFEECHGLQYLEQLDNHLNGDIQQQAQEIIDTFVGDAVDEDGIDNT